MKGLLGCGCSLAAGWMEGFGQHAGGRALRGTFNLAGKFVTAVVYAFRRLTQNDNI